MAFKVPVELERKILERSGPAVGVNLPVVRLDVVAAAHPGQRVSLALPWPPSVDDYYRSIPAVGRNGPYVKVLISKRGRQYKKDVATLVLAARLRPFGTMRVSLFVGAFPPDDGRKHDLGNLWKALEDSLQGSGLIDDDEQIDHESMTPGRERSGKGRVEVLIIPRKEVPQ